MPVPDPLLTLLLLTSPSSSRLLAEASARMAAFSAHDLALTSAGLASMRRKPNAEWLRRFLAQSLACMADFGWVHGPSGVAGV